MTAVWQWLAANWPNLLAGWVLLAAAVGIWIGAVVHRRDQQIPQDEDHAQH